MAALSAALRAPLCALLCLALTVAAHGRPSPVKVLSDGMWRELLQDEWMVEFYAPWCPACESLQPEWEKFAEWGEDLGVNVAKVDVTEQPGLSGRFIITALPTIYHCKDGEFRRYQGARTKAAFINFISDQEWKSIEPVSSWFGPSSLLMSSMSALFKLSMWIRVFAYISILSQYEIQLFLKLFSFIPAWPWLFNRKSWTTSLGLLCCFWIGNSVLRNGAGTYDGVPGRLHLSLQKAQSTTAPASVKETTSRASSSAEKQV